jgi:hypothetical protein
MAIYNGVFSRVVQNHIIRDSSFISLIFISINVTNLLLALTYIKCLFLNTLKRLFIDGLNFSQAAQYKINLLFKKN